VAAVVAPAVPHRVAAAVLQPAGVALRLAVAAAGWRLGSAPTSGAMSAPSARGGGIGMSGGSPRGAWTGRNVAGPSGGNWQGGPHWQGRHFAQRHHRTPFVTSGFAAPYFYDDSWPYDSYYGDNGCWAIRYIRGAYRRVWVCY